MCVSIFIQLMPVFNFNEFRMGTGGGRYIGQALNNTNPLRRDTILIPAYSYMVLRFVVDNRKSH
jgi:hypothetical protein